jgi:two-component sensor histidine kinase
VLTNRRANGETFLNALMVSPIRDEETGEITLFLGLQQEVSRDGQSERLQEFESLVAEIQHRVKNHLAMILSLIRMKAAEEAADGMVDLSRRIESLQLLYEELSAAKRAGELNSVKLGSYLGRVANAIAYLDGRPGVRMNVQVEPMTVQTEKAVRIGLIVSEVLTNAMQHAFAGRDSGLVELRVARTESGGVRAMVTDDGVGMPADSTWPENGGLGGRIVRGLCKGLGGSLHVSRGAVGSIVTLDVPDVG